MKKISIVTPCFNAEKYLGETIKSVIEQTAIISGKAELEYIICDGNSTDKTIDIVNSFRCDSIKIISEQDSGLYDALSKGLRKVSGDIVAYINAGDYYHKCAFDVVLDIFESKQVKWLTGYNIIYNEDSHVIRCILPYRYKKEFFACGFYGTKLPFVQQESTFWASSLNDLIDHQRLSQFKYAGDFYLWLQFSKKHELKIVEAYLGGFKFHTGQLSINKKAYYHEICSMISRPKIRENFFAMLEKLLWYFPPEIKKLINKEGLFRFDHTLGKWI